MIIRNNWSICILQLEIRRKFVLVSIHRCIGLSKSICIFACLFMSQGVFIQSLSRFIGMQSSLIAIRR